MAAPTIRPTPAASAAVDQRGGALRIRFVAEPSAPPASGRICREFTQPRSMLAVAEAIALADLPTAKPWPEPTGQLDIVYRSSSGVWPAPLPADWLAPPNHAEAAPAVQVQTKTASVQWRPGRALVEVLAEHRDPVIAALTDFAFYEGELRAMEDALDQHERVAPADVCYAYQIRQRDRLAWARFKQLAEYFGQLRLCYARLEPRLAEPSRTLPTAARKLMGRLLSKAGVAGRLEALNDRLEAMEEIYQGANDRVADFRWYRNGHLLEMGIIVLLIFECLVMSGDMLIRLHEFQAERQVVDDKGLDQSEEFRALITGVGHGRLSFKKSKEFIKAALGNEQNVPVLDDVKVLRGTLDKNTGEVEAGEPLEDGLKNELFKTAGEQPIRAILVTDPTNRKIAEIYVLTKKRP